MPILDDINRILRDHEKYTGNGGNGSLPIGDMTSARKPISKRDLRELLVLLAQASGDAGALDEIRDSVAARLITDQSLHIPAELFGLVSFTYAQMLSGASGMATIANQNSTAIEAANDYLAARGGGVVTLPAGCIPFSRTIRRSTGVRFRGVGAGRYLPFSASDKTFDGTILLAYGTGAKVHTFPGITSGELSGGWRPDPDNAGQTFRLFSAYNSNATGAAPATLRQFSVAILDDLSDGAGGFDGIRVMPWRGINGVSDYLSASAPLWGADWDFGYVCRNTERVENNDFAAVGPWRQAGAALMITLFDGVRFNRAEQNTFRNCLFDGRIGLLVRSLDTWKVTTTTSNAVRIAWTSEHYWPSSGTFRGSNNTTYTYTSTARDGGDLVFNGVTPDPTGIAHIRHASSGLANTVFEKCMAFDLMPQNGTTAQSQGIASSGLEISGFPLRGLQMPNFKVHTRGRVNSHLHAAADLTMPFAQVEGGGFFIASPEAAAQTWGPEAVYDTRNILATDTTGFSDGVDLRLFTPRNGEVSELQSSPRDNLSGNFVLRALRAGKALIAQILSGSTVDVLRSSGLVHTRFYDNGNVGILNGGQISLIGGVGRINYDTGQFFTIREGTTVRVQVGSSGTRLTLQGPYASDAAAASAGIEIGQLYRTASGGVTWRQV